MTIRFRNTLSGRLEPFKPLDGSHVGVYSCGPTVYGPQHVGNFRSYVFGDLLCRFLAWRGFDVTWVVNITDVDDRIIRDSLAGRMEIGELTEAHIAGFLEDWRTLRLGEPDARPRATEHIPEMAALITTLLERAHAYRTDDGSIFFRIASWPAYGRLAHLDPSQQRVGERVEADEYAKDDVRDFALWKGPRPGEPSWSTPIGEGRPGWHIECSAMSMKYLGQTFDLHTGGIDLIFPHHEDELAQSEAATGQPFARTWLHCAHLQHGGQKMARRTGRFDQPQDVYERGFGPRTLRYALLAAHYRAPLEYSDEVLRGAAAAVERLSLALGALDAYREDHPDDPELPGYLDAKKRTFREALDDDLNISAALAAVHELVREANRRLQSRGLSTSDAARAAALLRDVDRVLAVIEEDEDPLLPEAAAALLTAREAARGRREWATSDRLRGELLALGILVEDTRDGQRWRRAGEQSDD